MLSSVFSSKQHLLGYLTEPRMSSVHETAYPCFKSDLTEEELRDILTQKSWRDCLRTELGISIDLAIIRWIWIGKSFPWTTNSNYCNKYQLLELEAVDFVRIPADPHQAHRKWRWVFFAVIRHFSCPLLWIGGKSCYNPPTSKRGLPRLTVVARW